MRFELRWQTTAFCVFLIRESVLQMTTGFHIIFLCSVILQLRCILCATRHSCVVGLHGVEVKYPDGTRGLSFRNDTRNSTLIYRNTFVGGNRTSLFSFKGCNLTLRSFQLRVWETCQVRVVLPLNEKLASRGSGVMVFNSNLTCTRPLQPCYARNDPHPLPSASIARPFTAVVHVKADKSCYLGYWRSDPDDIWDGVTLLTTGQFGNQY